jgi:hypothetical protein
MSIESFFSSVSYLMVGIPVDLFSFVFQFSDIPIIPLKTLRDHVPSPWSVIRPVQAVPLSPPTYSI